MSDVGGMTMGTAPASTVATDPRTGGSSTASAPPTRVGPVGYGGYTGVSHGAGYSGVSHPEFEDTSPASVTPLVVAAEFILAVAGAGVMVEGAAMVIGLGIDVYEMVGEEVHHETDAKVLKNKRADPDFH